jgi:hypothetical protein
MDRIEDLLGRIRDPRCCAELLLGARRAQTRSIGGQLAAVLFSLPAVHRELGDEPGRLAAVGELVRRLGVLELLLLHAAGQRKGGWSMASPIEAPVSSSSSRPVAA